VPTLVVQEESTDESESDRQVPGGSVLRGAFDCDDRQMSPSAEAADSEIERDSGLTSNERLRRGAWGTTRPPWAGFEARHLGGRPPMVVDLVGSGGPESRVRSVTVVPGTERMQRSMTATLPYLPMAPNLCRMPRRRHQRLRFLVVNWLPWSERRCRGRWLRKRHSRNPGTAAEVGWQRKMAKPMTRREQ